MKFRKCKLSELGEIVGGATPSTKNKFNYGGNISWITPKDLTDLKGRFINRGERNITKEGFENSSTKMLPINSILFSSRAPIGYIAINNMNEVCTNQGFKSIIPNDKINYMFLYYLLKFNKDRIESLGSGTTFKEISGTVMKNIVVSIPENKNDQLKIAKVLSKIDEKIELNTHTNNNLYEIGLSLIEEEYNSINKTEKLQNIIQFTKGKKPVKIVKYKDKNFDKYLTIACLNYQELNYANKEKMILAQNDILMVMDGASSGEVYYSDCGIVGSTFARIDIINKIFTKEYMFFILKKYTDLIKTKNTGSAIPHVDKAFINLLSVPILSIENQKKYCIILKKIQQNEHKIRNLMIIRDTLLPKLMNGEIDIDKTEI